MDQLQAYWPLYPELLLALGAMALLMIGAFRPERDGEAEAIGWMAVVLLGMATWLVLLTLALTSSDGMVRRLGRRWQRLHRLVYLAGALAILHYAWHKAGKNLLGEPFIYGLVLTALLGLRLWWRLRAARRKNPPVLAA